jgi:hypothetical protein
MHDCIEAECPCNTPLTSLSATLWENMDLGNQKINELINTQATPTAPTRQENCHVGNQLLQYASYPHISEVNV